MILSDAPNDLVYLLGGEDHTGAKKSDFYVYDANAATWTSLASMPVGISFGTIGFVTTEFRGKTIVVAGGSGNSGSNSEVVYTYDLANDIWTVSPQEVR